MFIVHARVDESATHFGLKYSKEVFTVLSLRAIRHNTILVTPHELLSEKKAEIKRFRVLFCPCVVNKYTSSQQVVCKTFTQRGMKGIFVGFDVIAPGYLVFLPSIRQIIISIDVIFDESFISALVEKCRPYREAFSTRLLQELPPERDPDDHTGDISTMSTYSLPPSGIDSTSSITVVEETDIDNIGDVNVKDNTNKLTNNK